MQFIPARGRKLFSRLLFAHFTTLAIYPREGTETHFCHCENLLSFIAIYPREGTETYNSNRCRCSIPLQFIPARGRKRRVPPLPVVPILLQFIPARGRKLIVRFPVSTTSRIAIYPREGTETFPFSPWCNLLSLQFIPARGRKHFVIDLERKQKYYRFIPVRGRKRHKELPERFELFS